MIDISRNDCPPCSHFIPNKFRRDITRDLGAKPLSGVLLVQDIACALFVFHQTHGFFAPQVFPNGDVLHLGRNDSLPGIPELGHRMVLATQRTALQPRENTMLIASID